jgi:hypothetical protein
MEIVHPSRRQRADNNPRPDDDMDDFVPLLEEDFRHGADQARARNADDVIALLEENARLRGLVVRLSDIIIKSIADSK